MKKAVREMDMEGTGFGRIAVYSDVEKIRLENECDILVEVEPVRYKLELDKFDKDVKREVDKKVLATTSIFRFEEGTDTICQNAEDYILSV